MLTPRRQVDQLGHGTGVGVGLVYRIAARHRVHAREEDAVGLVANNNGARSTAESATATRPRLPARRSIRCYGSGGAGGFGTSILVVMVARSSTRIPSGEL